MCNKKPYELKISPSKKNFRFDTLKEEKELTQLELEHEISRFPAHSLQKSRI